MLHVYFLDLAVVVLILLSRLGPGVTRHKHDNMIKAGDSGGRGGVSTEHSDDVA